MLVQFDFSAFSVCQSLILSHDCNYLFNNFAVTSNTGDRLLHVQPEEMPYHSEIMFQFLYVCHPSVSSVFPLCFFYCNCFLIRNFPEVNELYVSLFLVFIHILTQNYSTFLKLPKLTTFKFYQLSPITFFFSPREFLQIFSPTHAVGSPVSAVSHEPKGDDQFYTLSEQKLETPTQIGSRGLKAISSVCGGLTCTQGLGGVY